MKAWKPNVMERRLEPCGFSTMENWVRVGHYDMEGCLFTDCETGEGAEFYGVTFTQCIFRRCRLPQARLGQCAFVDVRFEGCDFSNADLEESLWRRCELSDCRMVGAHFDEARFRQVRLLRCTAEFAGFDRASFREVQLEDCNLAEAYLRACKLREVEVSGCSFLKTNFYQTPLAGIDFTTSEIGGWTLAESTPELSGCIVTPVQAVELAERMGLVVKSGEP